ncbi:GAF domain-containing protein [bacterium]|nr:GAF domain-containing protein [candidate division CSSED10-310 bacterium]
MLSNFAVQSAFIASITNLFLAVFVITKAHRNAIHRTFALLSLLLMGWNMGTVLNEPQMIFLSVAFLPVVALHFTLLFIGERRDRKVLRLCYLLAILFAAGSISHLFPQSVLKYLLTLYLTPVSVLIMLRLHVKRRSTSSRIERLQLNYLLVGSGVALACGATDYFAGLGLRIPKLGSMGSLLYVVIIAVAIVRYRLLNVHLLIGRGIVLFAFTFVVWTLSGIAGAWWVGNTYNSFFAILVATVLLMIIYEPVKGLIERQSDRVLRHQSLELVNQLNRLSRELVSVISQQDLQKTMRSTFRRVSKIKQFAIYWSPAEHQGFHFIEGNQPPPQNLAVIGESTPLIEQLRLQKTPLDREELLRELQLWLLPENRLRIKDVVRAMNWLRADVCVPLHYHDQLLGFISLGGEESGEGVFTQREKDLLSAIGNQIAVSIANARIYERMKRSDRLIVLGEMAAGLAHEIRNPLGAIKAAAQFIGSGEDDSDHGEFLSIIIEEVNRLNKVVTRFLDYTRPVSAMHQVLDIAALTNRLVELLRPRLHQAGINCMVDFPHTPLLLRGDQDELKQVLLNLMNNATESMQAGGELRIEGVHEADTSAGAESGQENSVESLRGGWIRLRIRDTGIGIPEENLDRLFTPFFTTKAEGTGLGLAIVHKIVDAHNGTIMADSRSGEGTSFTISLPAAFPDDKTAGHDVGEERSISA